MYTTPWTLVVLICGDGFLQIQSAAGEDVRRVCRELVDVVQNQLFRLQHGHFGSQCPEQRGGTGHVRRCHRRALQVLIARPRQKS